MPTRHANATWTGALQDGEGTLETESGALDGPYSFASRFEEGPDTNPEELIGAALSGCFSMALANELDEAGYDPQEVATDAAVSLDGETLSIDGIELTVEATVPDIEADAFMEFAEGTKENCPVSKALAGVDISLDATLVE